jgi:hypothetical protein
MIGLVALSDLAPNRGEWQAERYHVHESRIS